MKIQVEVQGPQWIARSPRRTKRLAAAMVATLVLAIPAAVLATHDFSDVQTSDQFHTQISAIKGAGITGGCGAGIYCPADFVRRDAMAAFMHRGFGRITHRVIGPFSLTSSLTSMGSLTITPGAIPGGTGFIKADGYVQLFTAAATGCPCILEGYARLDGDPMVSRTSIFTVPAGAASVWMMMPITGALETTSSGPRTVDIYIRATGTSSWTANADLVASYFPFGGAGGTVLGAGDGPALTGPGTVNP